MHNTITVSNVFYEYLIVHLQLLKFYKVFEHIFPIPFPLYSPLIFLTLLLTV